MPHRPPAAPSPLALSLSLGYDPAPLGGTCLPGGSLLGIDGPRGQRVTWGGTLGLPCGPAAFIRRWRQLPRWGEGGWPPESEGLGVSKTQEEAGDGLAATGLQQPGRVGGDQLSL